MQYITIDDIFKLMNHRYFTDECQEFLLTLSHDDLELLDSYLSQNFTSHTLWEIDKFIIANGAEIIEKLREDNNELYNETEEILEENITQNIINKRKAKAMKVLYEHVLDNMTGAFEYFVEGAGTYMLYLALNHDIGDMEYVIELNGEIIATFRIDYPMSKDDTFNSKQNRKRLKKSIAQMEQADKVADDIMGEDDLKAYIKAKKELENGEAISHEKLKKKYATTKTSKNIRQPKASSKKIKMVKQKKPNKGLLEAIKEAEDMMKNLDKCKKY